ncbi:uncharacterized protein [Nicotiana tomentosiformis]|uniref:uncharacterized protein n=1 Tax=Nicotiana tomentosiformis TaxID=4098 RepID=UPI00388C9A38
MDILYHSGKVNVVADALNRKYMGSLAHLETCQRPLAREVHQLASLGVRLANSNVGGVIVRNSVESSLVAEVKEKQYNDPVLVQLKEGIHKLKTTSFSLGMDDGTLRYQGRLCVPNVDGLRERIMAEAYTSRYFVHSGSTTMYHDLKEVYWWNDTKRGVADFVAKSHFLLVKFTDTAEQYAQLYIKEIVRLHGTPVSIISNRGAQFTANFWKKFQQGLGTQVNLSMAFHPHTDGQAERTIQMLEDMFRACVLDLKGS